MTTRPTRYPGAEWRPIPINHSDGGMAESTRGFIPHVQMGSSPCSAGSRIRPPE